MFTVMIIQISSKSFLKPMVLVDNKTTINLTVPWDRKYNKLIGKISYINDFNRLTQNQKNLTIIKFIDFSTCRKIYTC